MLTAHEKMFNITNHQRNANQNHNDTTPHTFQDKYHQKEHKKQMLASMWRKRKPLTLLMGMQIGATTVENEYGGFSKN